MTKELKIRLANKYKEMYDPKWQDVRNLVISLIAVGCALTVFWTLFWSVIL
ncbi:MAG: hypothetical protein Q8Q48_04115 [Candidatus Staskawiczbacteria bacterium]|nr:hypothetical protein [Candidatus Staskawiczbacteria bacterium]